MDKITYKIKSDIFNKEFNTFSMQRNQTYFLLGENAIGKTTLLNKMTSGLNKNEKLKYPIFYDVKISKNEIFGAYQNINLDDEVLKKLIDQIGDIERNDLKMGDEDKEHPKIEKLNKLIEDELIKKHSSQLNKLNNEANSLITKVINIVNENRKDLQVKINEKVFSLKDMMAKQFTGQDQRILRNITKIHTTKGLEKMFADSWIDNIKGKCSIYEIDGFAIVPVFSDKMKKKQQDIYDALNEISAIFKKRTKLKFTSKHDSYLPSINNLIWKLNIKMSRMENFNDYFSDNKQLSLGERVMNWLEKIKDRQIKMGFVNGIAFDEPFNHLDDKRTKEAIKIISGIPGTKLIATHSSKAIKYSQLENIIIMWKDENGKYCVGNASSLRKIKKDKKVYEFISSVLNEAIFDTIALGKKILIVEGYYDLKILSPHFPNNEYAVWPIGGVPYAKLSIGFAERISNNFRILLDNDEAGRVTEGNLTLSSDKAIFIRGKVFGGFNGDLEGLISGKTGANKHKIRREIVNQNRYQKEIKDIADRIKETFN